MFGTSCCTICLDHPKYGIVIFATDEDQLIWMKAQISSCYMEIGALGFDWWKILKGGILVMSEHK